MIGLPVRQELFILNNILLSACFSCIPINQPNPAQQRGFLFIDI